MHKQMIPKLLRRLGAILGFVLILGLICPTYTPKIPGEDSISELSYIKVNGTKLQVMIRGHHKSNPIIVVVHGGPGCSEIPYITKYQAELEKHFTILHYDQRASGKSYHFFEDYTDVSTDLLVEDLIALSQQVSKRFDNQQLILLGHSFGTYLAMQAVAQSPQLYRAYIGIGQVADPILGELDNLEYCITQAKAQHHLSDTAALEGLREAIESGQRITPRSYVRKYGGAARLISETKDMVTGVVFHPEYNLLDVLRYHLGIAKYQDRLMGMQAQAPITELVEGVEIPLWFVMGQYDHMTSTAAARAYFDTLAAPQKTFLVYEQSAHYPQLEEQDRFTSWMIETFAQ